MNAATDVRLASYALAAVAAGVGLQSAQAEVVYVATHQELLPNSVLNLDLNHDGVSDFAFRNYRRYHSSGGRTGSFFSTGSLRVRGLRGNQVIGTLGTFSRGLALALSSGYIVKSRAKFLPPGSLFMRYCGRSNDRTNVFGPWDAVIDRYLGLKFTINGETHFGWARLSERHVNCTLQAVLTGYAFETVPSKPILTGQTSSMNPGRLHRPEAGQLGHLAAGK
jgi:hypothetical protein